MLFTFVTVGSLFVGLPVFGMENEEAPCPLEPVSSSWLEEVKSLPSDLFEIRLKGGMVFKLNRELPGGQAFLQELSAEKRELFFRRRKNILTKIVQIFAFPRTLGAMTWSKSKVRACLGSKEKKSNIDELVEMQFDQAGVKIGFLKKRGYETLARLIQALDFQIWNDGRKFVGARSVSQSFLFNLSGGAAVLQLGLIEKRGLQFDFAYDFEKEEVFFRKHIVKGRKKTGVFAFELMLEGGFFREYRMDDEETEDISTLVNFPFGLAYQSGSQTAGFGLLFSVLNIWDLAGVGLMTFSDHFGPGAAMIALGRMASFVSIYTLHIERKEIPRSGKWRVFYEKMKKILAFKDCNNLLK